MSWRALRRVCKIDFCRSSARTWSAKSAPRRDAQQVLTERLQPGNSQHPSFATEAA